MPEQLTDLAQYGLVGVIILFIIAFVVIFKEVLKFMGNHVNHNTQMMEKLINTLDNLKDFIISKK